MESRASDEQVSLTSVEIVRRDGNGNDNWDTITNVGLNLNTPSGSVRCDAESFPDPSIPSNVNACADPAYSFQITDRPGYGLYTFVISHEVSDSVTLTGSTQIGCNGPIPVLCDQDRGGSATLTAA